MVAETIHPACMMMMPFNCSYRNKNEMCEGGGRGGERGGRAFYYTYITYNGNPLVDVRTGAGHADVRLGGLWNRHVWKKEYDLSSTNEPYSIP